MSLLRRRVTLQSLLLSLVSMLMLGCSASKEDVPETTVIKSIGLLTLNEFFGRNLNADIAAVFYSDKSNKRTVAEIQQKIMPTTDQCYIGRKNYFSVLSDDTSEAKPLSAGAELRLMDSAGMVWPLTQNRLNFYLPTTDDFPYPLSKGLMVDIPGDQFPAIGSVTIPDVSAITGFLPEISQAITINAQLSWDAGSDPNARIIVRSNTSSSTKSDKEFICALLDDGAFELPASIKEVLGPDYTTTKMQISRDVFSFVQKNDALFVVIHSITETGFSSR